ncbi:MAG: nucleotidyltransferase family protein [Candidatus Hydrothermarchaeota archaeon]
MDAVILAAGKGKRLMPITERIAKPLLPIDGKPVIEQIVISLKKLGFKRIFIIIGHLGNQIEKYLGNGSKYNIKIEYRRQVPLGTAHALRCVENDIKGDFLVTASDSIFPLSHIRDLVKKHKKERCDATISLKKVNIKDIPSMSTVTLQGDRILKIVEKPKKGQVLSNISASPLYVFGDVVFDFLKDVRISERGEYELQDAIQKMIDSNLCVKGVFSEKWKHLTDINDLIELNFPYLIEFMKDL